MVKYELARVAAWNVGKVSHCFDPWATASLMDVCARWIAVLSKSEAPMLPLCGIISTILPKMWVDLCNCFVYLAASKHYMWYQLDWQSSIWLAECPKWMPTMFHSPDMRLSFLVIVNGDSCWGTFLATNVVRIQSSNGLPTSLLLVMLTLRHCHMNLWLRRSSLASSFVRLMKVKYAWRPAW